MGKRKKNIFSTQFITTTISTTLVLVLLGIVVLFVLTAKNLSDAVKENINISVLISDDMNETQISDMQASFKSDPYVSEIEYISKEQAIEEQIEELGTDPSEFLGFNPFTASFEINLKAEYANNDSINKIVSKLKGDPNIVDVIYQQDLLNIVDSNIRKITIILLIIAALFTYISFALINNTVQLTIFSRRFIINTMKLVGASWAFIRKPFVTRGFTLGIISAILADALIVSGVFWLQTFEPTVSSVIGFQELIIVSVAVFLFGILITFICTYFSLQKYLKMTTNELYYI